MRKIKFRAWWKKQLRYNAIVGNGQCLFIPNATGEYKWVNIAECNVMQFSGLHDIKGTEIYEEDIVTIKSYNFPHQEKEKFRIAYSQEDMMFKFVSVENQREYDKYGFHSIEIIGNIYENPELCKL